MKTKIIALCTPTLGLLHVNWVAAYSELIWPLNTGKAQLYVTGKPVAEARNETVARALSIENEDREVTHLFWIDDDVIVPRTALLQLLRHHRPIASGVYFTRAEPGEPLIFPNAGGGTLEFIPDQAYEVWGHGMGLTLIETEVYRKMQRELDLGTDSCGYPAWYKTTGGEDCKVNNQILDAGGTEDLYFLDRASQLGISGFVDTSANAFGWHHERKTNKGYPEKQYKQMKTQQPIVWETSEGTITWTGG